MARRKESHLGGHGWFVTFADLMGLLVSFFVMLVTFSTQDQAKLQVVAGSMRNAFGVQDRVRYSGIIEVLGPADTTETQKHGNYQSRGQRLVPHHFFAGNAGIIAAVAVL